MKEPIFLHTKPFHERETGKICNQHIFYRDNWSKLSSIEQKDYLHLLNETDAENGPN